MNENLSTVAINPFYGQAGHFFIILAFVAAIIASISYFFAVKKTDEIEKVKWKKLARYAFFTHALSILATVVTLFLMIFNHRFEYYYVWSHSSLDLPIKYILSCFWEGQEGSFLLWTFWMMMLGTFLIFTSKKWEAPVLTFISIQQVFLVSFLLGIYIGEIKIGLSPFLLMKDALTQDPVFMFENYMDFIKDGTGLNALLQNYWMVIHPPVLFLGFASVTIPFAFAFAGLWTKKYSEWIKPALPYSLFSGMILGTGVLMGGAWAYEALSFGGFWAWDPVENASLIPWLITVAGIHLLLIVKATGHALRTTFIMLFLAFFFVLYASFLTRSGILGDSSVHSFVVSGLENHLLIYLTFFTGLGIIMIARNWKHIPTNKKEEEVSSREFWMFIGSLVFLFSGLHIIFFTGIPVYNQIFLHMNDWFGTGLRTDFAPPADPIHYYTAVQIWVAVIIAIFTGFAQFLKYRKTDIKKFFKVIIISIALAIVLMLISANALDYPVFTKATLNIFGKAISLYTIYPYTLLLFAGSFAILANAHYLIAVLKGKIKIAGGSVAHIGFGILLLGILISNANQQVLSINTQGINYGEEFDQKFKRDNILLYQNVPVTMGEYIVTYLSDSSDNRETFYKVRYEKINNKTGAVDYTFDLYPYLLMDKKSKQLTPNPDTKHYLTHDVFTHISSIPSQDARSNQPITEEHTVAIGDTIFFSKGYLVLNDIRRYTDDNSISAGALFVGHTGDSTETVEPKFTVADNQILSEPVAMQHADVQLTFDYINTDDHTFKITTIEKNVQNNWIIMKAIVFPMINLVWLGMTIMAIGFFISMLRRRTEMKTT
ncbi:MAG: cytochrome c biogenesis protein CcsA [Chitinophagales bacterium]|nr:cytochrome c biogenesis protein CcsA [Bacteroidota bacterium]MBK8682771.1 cytochrome c biogenesis protein CcsA [Bacteroidota bacterium]